MAPVPISFVVIDHAAWAYAAMGMLGEMISGQLAPGTVRSFPPDRIIELASTGGESGGDPLCARALEMMREHLANPLDVPELAAQLGVSATTLKRLFSESYGIGVAKRYLAIRLEAAKGLLSAGEKVESVALSVGFSSARSFRAAFIDHTGVAPSDYGRQRGQPVH
jgi:transcriptional regulator GlxA family with amidase domain